MTTQAPTTGSALPLWYTREALAEEYAAVWRMRRACGVREPSAPNLTFNGQSNRQIQTTTFNFSTAGNGSGFINQQQNRIRCQGAGDFKPFEGDRRHVFGEDISLV